jgi:hypothetical protein
MFAGVGCQQVISQFGFAGLLLGAGFFQVQETKEDGFGHKDFSIWCFFFSIQ